MILLVVAAGGGKPQDLKSVIGMADYINHAIPTRGELEGAFTRLGAAGLVRRRKAGFYPTPRALELFDKTIENCGTGWLRRLHGLAALADCPCCGVRFGKPSRLVEIDASTYEETVAAYRKGSGD